MLTPLYLKNYTIPLLKQQTIMKTNFIEDCSQKKTLLLLLNKKNVSFW